MQALARYQAIASQDVEGEGHGASPPPPPVMFLRLAGEEDRWVCDHETTTASSIVTCE